MSYFVAVSVGFVFSTCNTSQLMWHKNIQLCSRYIFSEMFLYMDYIFFCTHRLGHILHFSYLWFLAVKRSLTKFILSVYEGTMITGLRVTGLTIKKNFCYVAWFVSAHDFTHFFRPKVSSPTNKHTETRLCRCSSREAACLFVLLKYKLCEGWQRLGTSTAPQWKYFIATLTCWTVGPSALASFSDH